MTGLAPRQQSSRAARIGSALFYLVVALVAAAAFARVEYASPYIPEYDGYYHIKFAELIRQRGFISTFPWLPLTTFGQRFADMHLLFHYLLVPFTFLGLMEGAKLSAVVFSIAAVLAFAWLLRGEKVPVPLLWVVGLLTSSVFLYRFALPRASQVSVLCLLLGLRLIWRERAAGLGVLAFFYTWLYTAFPMLLAVAVCHLFARILFREQVSLKPVLGIVLGTAAGLIINPYFPNNLWYFYTQTFLISALQRIPMGGEWYPFDTWYFLKENSIVFVFLFLAGFFTLFEKRGRDAKTVSLYFLTCFFLLLSFKSRRFVEYFVPFAVLFAGFALRETLLDAASTARGRRWYRGLLCLILLTTALSAWQAVNRSARDIEVNTLGTLNPRFGGCAQWLAENTPQDSLVFHADWDDFPALFFYDTHNRYIVGLDPNFLYLRDPGLWQTYAGITQGFLRNPASLIRERFGADYVFSDTQHMRLLKNLYDEARAKLEYESDACVVYRLTDEPVR